MVNSLKTAALASLIGLASQAVIPAQAGLLAENARRFDSLVQQVASGGKQRCTRARWTCENNRSASRISSSS